MGVSQAHSKKKHILVGYVFIKDRIAVGEITLENCLTGKMLLYHFMNPLHSLLLMKFRTEIQGILYYTGELDMCFQEADESVVPIPQEWVGYDGKYTGTSPCSNRINGQGTSPCSNRWGILKIQSGSDRDLENSPKNNYDVDYCARNYSPITGSPKPIISYSDVVQGVMRKQ